MSAEPLFTKKEYFGGNSVPGRICKTHPKSRIAHMHIKSDLATEMLTASAKKNPRANEKDIVVLQVVNSVEGYILVEYMYKDDYEAENVVFNPDGSRNK